MKITPLRNRLVRRPGETVTYWYDKSSFFYTLYVTPTAAFSPTWLLSIIAASVIGGAESIEGPIIGALLVVSLWQFLFVSFPVLGMLINGVLIIIVSLLAPEEIWGL